MAEKRLNDQSKRGLDSDFIRGELIELANKARPSDTNGGKPQITEEEYQKQTSGVIHHNKVFLREIHRVDKIIAEYNTLEPIVWMKSKVLSYCSTHAVHNQTDECIKAFLEKLGPFLREHDLILSKNEILNLINLRPSDETCLMLAISSLLDRLPSAQTRQQLLEMIAILPEPPEVVFDDDIANDITDEVIIQPEQPGAVKPSHTDNHTTDAHGDDDDDDDDNLDQDLNMLNQEMQEEMVLFINDASAQFDRDEDLFGDD